MASNYYESGYHHQQQQYQHYDDHYQQQYASSSSHAYNDYAPQESAEPEPELNMAGFGARRMAETSRRKAEEEDRRMREWERQQQQYEEQERMARLQWEEERRAQWEYEEEQERRRRHEQEEEEQRQREAQWYYEQQAQQQQQQHNHSGYEEHQPRYREDSHSAAYADDMHEDPAVAAQQWYQEDHAASTSTNKQWSSDSDPIATSNDGPTFSHDDSGYAHDGAPYSSDDSGAIFKGSHLAPPGTSSSPRGSLAGIRSSLLDRRVSVYEDTYEEGDEAEDHVDITANLSRYTHYGGPADDANTSSSGDAVWSGARKSLFRNTTYQPLPKARCADCLEELDFDELADHACDQASSPATPLFALPPSARTPGSEVTTPLSDVSPSSTSFFDKYASYEQERPKVAAAQEAAAMVRSSSEGDHAHHKASQGGLGLGLGGVPTMPTRSNSSPSTSPARGASPQDESIQDRRKRIEAQREAKRRAGGSSPSPSFTTSPPNTLATLVEPPSPTKPSPTKTARPQRGHSPSRNVSSSSSASSGSYSSTNSASSSAFQATVSVSITPSSSFSHESSHDDGRCHEGSSSRDLLSPEMASGPFRKEAKKATGGHHHQRSASAVAVEAARKLRLEQLAATAAAAAGTSTPANKSPRLPRKEVDLGGIEDLMETLQVNSSTDKKTKSSKTAQAPASSSEKPRRRANRPPQLTLSTVARHDNGGGVAPPSSSRSTRKHPPRKCSVCQCSLSSFSRTAFIEKDGNYFCATDYRDLYLPKCSKCSHPVERDAVKSSDGALRGIFHRGCFCCFDCDAPFARGVFYVWKDRPYCLDHYSKRAGTQCVSCYRGIEGVCRQTMVGDTGTKELFHPACLRCEMDDCRQVLEDFYVVGGKRLCERHAEVVQSIVDEAVAAKVGAKMASQKKKKRAEKRTTMLRALS